MRPNTITPKQPIEINVYDPTAENYSPIHILGFGSGPEALYWFNRVNESSRKHKLIYESIKLKMSLSSYYNKLKLYSLQNIRFIYTANIKDWYKEKKVYKYVYQETT